LADLHGPTALSLLEPYVPSTLIRRILKTPVVKQEANVERFEAAVLFSDISGFTPLAEALSKKGPEGPEELTRVLNSCFSRIIGLIERQGGEVTQFTGDALTVLFPVRDESLGHCIRRARQAADAIHGAMREFEDFPSIAGPLSLNMRSAIGAGHVMDMEIGGYGGRWEYVVVGDPLRQIAEAQAKSHKGEIVLSPEAQAGIYPEILTPHPLVAPTPSESGIPDAYEDRLRCFVPQAVLSWLDQGLQEWLGVLRPMTVLFVGVNGLTYTDAQSAIRLHLLLREAQEIIGHYEGTLRQLAMDDKGSGVQRIY